MRVDDIRTPTQDDIEHAQRKEQGCDALHKEVPESYTVTGEGYRRKNVGVMANKGIELSADGDIIRTPDLLGM